VQSPIALSAAQVGAARSFPPSRAIEGSKLHKISPALGISSNRKFRHLHAAPFDEELTCARASAAGLSSADWPAAMLVISERHESAIATAASMLGVILVRPAHRRIEEFLHGRGSELYRCRQSTGRSLCAATSQDPRSGTTAIIVPKPSAWAYSPANRLSRGAAPRISASSRTHASGPAQRRTPYLGLTCNAGLMIAADGRLNVLGLQLRLCDPARSRSLCPLAYDLIACSSRACRPLERHRLRGTLARNSAWSWQRVANPDLTAR